MRKIVTILLAAITFTSFATQDPTLLKIKQHIDNQLNKEKHNVVFTVTSTVPGTNGVRNYYGIQVFENLPIYGTEFNIAVQNDEIITFNHHFIVNPEQYAQSNKVLNEVQALQIIVGDAGIEEFSVVEKRLGVYEYYDLNLSDEAIAIKQMWVLEEGILIPSYEVSLYELDHSHWYNTRINATNGQIINQNDWVNHCKPYKLSNVSKKLRRRYIAPTPVVALKNKKAATASYNVFAMPTESPNHGPRTIEEDPDDASASPYGWHDTNGSAGAEYTITRGNNVYASEDANADNVPGNSPDGGTNLEFNSAFDINQSAANYRDAAITNLFYWNNIIHDVWWHYGFDEPSGNFQFNNYSNGGLGSDEVNADAVDGSGTNNANFATPNDGQNPRMQMFLWNTSSSGDDYFQVNTPAPSQKYLSNFAQFGAELTSTPVTGDLVLVDDGSSWSERGCNALVNGSNVSGKIAFIERGNCTFVNKVLNAQNAGAIGVVIYDSTNNNPITMGGTNNSITIPAVMIRKTDGLYIKGLMSSQTVNVSLYDSSTSAADTYDSDFDNGVISHEYAHGISNRLTGGPNNSGCLTNAEQMGEGWSDFVGLVMTHQPGDEASDARGIGTYVAGEPTNGGGIRPYPYSVDLSVSPYDYDDVKRLSLPHGIGSVWCSMIWDMYWRMIEEHGYDSNIYTGTGGNNMAMQLVLDGMKLQPCNPGFVDGRNAILEADLANYNGANRQLIWEVFARRGLGYDADQGSSDDRSDGTMGFSLPPFLNDLDVAKLAPSEINNTDSITYALKVWNYTDATVYNIEVRDTLDGSLFLEDNLDCGATFQDGFILYTIDSLPKNDSFVCNFTARVKSEQAGSAIFSDDMESGEEGWTIESGLGTNAWARTTVSSKSGDYSWFVQDVATSSDQYLTRSFDVSGASPILSFEHKYITEAGWDGGVVEIRTAGGAWKDVEDLFISNGYNSTISVNPASALSGRNGFTGSSDTFINSQIDLSSYADQTVEVRWRFATDGAQGGLGWYIDDVSLDNAVLIDNHMFVAYGTDKTLRSSVTTIVKGDAITGSVLPQYITGLKVYPNPTQNELKIELPADTEYVYSVVSSDGKLMTRKSGNGLSILDVSSWSTGVYFCSVTVNSQTSVTKVIVE